MKKFFAAVVALIGSLFFSIVRHTAQDAIVQEGEFGIGLGAAHYFGDLNTRAHLNRPKMAATVFFRKILAIIFLPVLRPLLPEWVILMFTIRTMNTCIAAT